MTNRVNYVFIEKKHLICHGLQKAIRFNGMGRYKRGILDLKHGFKDITGPAYFHFFFPVPINLAVTNSAVDKPAKLT